MTDPPKKQSAPNGRDTNAERPAGDSGPETSPVLVAILGPTASGKTKLAVALARWIGGEILSADSRQVFQGMDIGTGKDLDEYRQGGPAVPVHLVDIRKPGQPFSLFDYIVAYIEAFESVVARGAVPILCGGSGMYLDAVLRRYELVPAPQDPDLRRELDSLSWQALVERLKKLKRLHNTTDLVSRETLIRAIEIETYAKAHPDQALRAPKTRNLVFGLRWPRPLLRERIAARLEDRLRQGLLREVQGLLDQGVPEEVLSGYGLEYRYTLDYLMGRATRQQMQTSLTRAIWSFAKRQETWFRRMERLGVAIHWLEGPAGLEQNLERMLHLLESR